MFLFETTCKTPAENVALDEVLLDEAAAAGSEWECLRLWEPSAPFVVVGANSSIAAEVNEEMCRERGVEVLRRSSGGAAIVAGPGCLMYALVLSYNLRPKLRMIDAAHKEILGTICAAFRPFSSGVEPRGDSDLAIGGVKFSGNSLRCKRTHLLYHGTVLYDFDLSLIPTLLREPPRQPDYRNKRTHEDFVRNFPASRQSIRDALIEAWHADAPLSSIPRERLTSLVESKYSQREWNYRRE